MQIRFNFFSESCSIRVIDAFDLHKSYGPHPGYKVDSRRAPRSQARDILFSIEVVF